jgi:hypothetical protein
LNIVINVRYVDELLLEYTLLRLTVMSRVNLMAMVNLMAEREEKLEKGKNLKKLEKGKNLENQEKVVKKGKKPEESKNFI